MTLVVEEDTPSTQHSKAADVVEKTDDFESNHISKEKFGGCDIVAINVVKKTNSPESNPITVEEYKEYVTGLHSLNNKGFETQYKVYYKILCCCDGLIIPKFSTCMIYFDTLNSIIIIFNEQEYNYYPIIMILCWPNYSSYIILFRFMQALPSEEEGKQVSIGKSGDHRHLNRFKNV